MVSTQYNNCPTCEWDRSTLKYRSGHQDEKHDRPQLFLVVNSHDLRLDFHILVQA